MPGVSINLVGSNNKTNICYDSNDSEIKKNNAVAASGNNDTANTNTSIPSELIGKTFYLVSPTVGGSLSAPEKVLTYQTRIWNESSFVTNTTFNSDFVTDLVAGAPFNYTDFDITWDANTKTLVLTTKSEEDKYVVEQPEFSITGEKIGKYTKSVGTYVFNNDLTSYEVNVVYTGGDLVEMNKFKALFNLIGITNWTIDTDKVEVTVVLSGSTTKPGASSGTASGGTLPDPPAVVNLSGTGVAADGSALPPASAVWDMPNNKLKLLQAIGPVGGPLQDVEFNFTGTMTDFFEFDNDDFDIQALGQTFQITKSKYKANWNSVNNQLIVEFDLYSSLGLWGEVLTQGVLSVVTLTIQ
jgi:hypothetical protein